MTSRESASLVEEPIARVSELVNISIAFTVESVFDVAAGLADEGVLCERKLERPYVKDYDAIIGEGPSYWSRRFDLTNWGLLSAYAAGERVGAAVVACNTPGVDMLEDRVDLAALWDVRVATHVRRRGIGAQLFCAVETWARSRGCRQLKIETQNTNVAACRFYERMGCTLRGIHRFAYPGLPNETQLLWYKDLPSD